MGESMIENDIREFLATNFPLASGWDQIGPADSLIEVGVIDSTGVLELVEFIESHFEIAIPLEELLPENLDSIENISRYVSAKLDGAGVDVAG
jgi:acyl carrier protein